MRACLWQTHNFISVVYYVVIFVEDWAKLVLSKFPNHFVKSFIFVNVLGTFWTILSFVFESVDASGTHNFILVVNYLIAFLEDWIRLLLSQIVDHSVIRLQTHERFWHAHLHLVVHSTDQLFSVEDWIFRHPYHIYSQVFPAVPFYVNFPDDIITTLIYIYLLLPGGTFI